MTPADTVTTDLLHRLVTGSHAEGVIELAVCCIVDHEDRILLVVEPGLDCIDETWQLPTGSVLPGETLTNAAARILATHGLDLHEVTGYLGHNDRIDADGELSREFCFAVIVANPHSICRSAHIRHWWIDNADLADLSAPNTNGPDPAVLAGWTSTTRPNPEPSLATPLRASARHLHATEAGTELLIRHATWLRRSDFRDRFVHLDTSITNGTELATIDWRAAITALDGSDLPCSGGEGRMLRLAASLIDGIPVDLRDTLTGLDARNLHLVSQAVLETAGH